MDSSLRTAAQQALEALEDMLGWQSLAPQTIQESAKGRAAALRAALAEPTPLEDVVTHGSAWSKDGKRIDPMSVYAEPVQEPVAWMTHGNDLLPLFHKTKAGALAWGSEPQPLYAAPPHRKPLTEEEIRDLWSWAMTAEAERTATTQQHAFARAIERAHGIDGAPEERNFCPRCGKRANGIHTCTPPAPLTDEVIAELWHQNGGFHHHFARAIERWLKGNP